jgi:hypothetical protein
MLYLLGARSHPFVRALVGVAMLVVGLVWHGDVLLELIGGAMIIWGTCAQVASMRRRQADAAGQR